MTDADVAAQVTAVWQRIEAALDAQFPAALTRLGAPATPGEIAAAEDALGYRFPADFAASLAAHRVVDLTVHGPRIKHYHIAELAKMRDFALELEAWSSEDPDTETRNGEGWRRGWIPLANYDADWIALDTDPGPLGVHGQLIFRGNDSSKAIEAPSWLGALTSFASELEAGRYRLRESSHWVSLWHESIK